MLKFLLIIFVVFYILIKVGGFIMKTLFSGFANGEQNSHRTQQNQYRSTRTKDGSVNIDYIPNQDKTKSGKKNFPGGDYVDYEEVK